MSHNVIHQLQNPPVLTEHFFCSTELVHSLCTIYNRTDKSQLSSQVSNKRYILANCLNTAENNKLAAPNTFEINDTIVKRFPRELDFTLDVC